MYPVSLGYGTAIKRIRSLIKNEHYSESLVTSVFTAEKTIRRTLRQLVVSAGFTSIYANKIIKSIRGLKDLIDSWEIYDPKNQKLSDVVDKIDLQTIRDAAQMRNKLVHGERVYKLDLCKVETEKVLSALDNIKIKFDSEYGYSGWTKSSSRKTSKLHKDPKVKIS